MCIQNPKSFKIHHNIFSSNGFRNILNLDFPFLSVFRGANRPLEGRGPRLTKPWCFTVRLAKRNLRSSTSSHVTKRTSRTCKNCIQYQYRNFFLYVYIRTLLVTIERARRFFQQNFRCKEFLETFFACFGPPKLFLIQNKSVSHMTDHYFQPIFDLFKFFYE